MLAKSIVGLDDFIPWRESTDRWKRRAVPVTMLILLKKPFDPKGLDFIRPMMLDKESRPPRAGCSCARFEEEPRRD